MIIILSVTIVGVILVVAISSNVDRYKNSHRMNATFIANQL